MGEKRLANGFAIASLVIGIVSFVQLLGMEKAIVAIIFGLIALKSAQQKKIAVTGIILGLVYIIAVAVVMIKFSSQLQQLIEQLMGR